MDLSDGAPETLRLRAAPARGPGGVTAGRPPKTPVDTGHGNLAPPKRKSPLMLLDDTVLANQVKATISLKYAFGSSSASMNDGLATFAVNTAADKERNDRLIYRVGKQVCLLDPETGAQQFFTGRSRSVNSILHFVVSPNQRHVSMCESMPNELREDHGGGSAQLSIYSLRDMNKVKTLSFPCGADFICSTFCTDPKMIAALSGEMDRQIVLWQWDKDKIIKTVNVHVPATRLRTAPGSLLMLTTTGRFTPINSYPDAHTIANTPTQHPVSTSYSHTLSKYTQPLIILLHPLELSGALSLIHSILFTTPGIGMMRCWFVGADGNLKSGPLLPPAKETESFIDHCWLPTMAGGLQVTLTHILSIHRINTSYQHNSSPLTTLTVYTPTLM